MNTLEFVFDWSEKEHQRASFSVMWHGSQRWWLVVVLCVAGFVIAFFGGLTVLRLALGDWSGSLSALPWFLVGVFWAVLFLWWSPRAMARRSARLNSGTQHFMLTLDSVKGASMLGATELKWSAITRVVETPTFFLFYFAGNAAFYLPKRAVSGEALPSVREQVRRVVDTRAHLFNA